MLQHHLMWLQGLKDITANAPYSVLYPWTIGKRDQKSCTQPEPCRSLPACYIWTAGRRLLIVLLTTGARTTIANAAYSFLYPWTQKGNMAVRLKKLHDSAQYRYNKHRDWLAKAVADEAPAAGPLQSLSSHVSATAQNLSSHRVSAIKHPNWLYQFCDKIICNWIVIHAVLLLDSVKVLTPVGAAWPAFLAVLVSLTNTGRANLWLNKSLLGIHFS